MRIQAMKLQLAVRQSPCVLLIFPSRHFDPVSSHDIAVNHETESKNNIALVSLETLHTQSINLYASIKDACQCNSCIQNRKKYK